jgi:hypothetical protein
MILREKAMSAPKALPRALHSAGNDAFRRGRITRAYLASAVVNLKTWSLLKVINRLLSAAVLAGVHVLRPAFWRGIYRRKA